MNSLPSYYRTHTQQKIDEDRLRECLIVISAELESFQFDCI